jgi:hypothetical protein
MAAEWPVECVLINVRRIECALISAPPTERVPIGAPATTAREPRPPRLGNPGRHHT